MSHPRQKENRKNNATHVINTCQRRQRRRIFMAVLLKNKIITTTTIRSYKQIALSVARKVRCKRSRRRNKRRDRCIPATQQTPPAPAAKLIRIYLFITPRCGRCLSDMVRICGKYPALPRYRQATCALSRKSEQHNHKKNINVHTKMYTHTHIHTRTYPQAPQPRTQIEHYTAKMMTLKYRSPLD